MVKRSVWTTDELAGVLLGLATVGGQLEPQERRGFLLAVASVARAVGIEPDAELRGQDRARMVIVGQDRR